MSEHFTHIINVIEFFVQPNTIIVARLSAPTSFEEARDIALDIEDFIQTISLDSIREAFLHRRTDAVLSEIEFYRDFGQGTLRYPLT